MAPTKTATRLGGRVEEIRELDDCTCERVTIVLSTACQSMRRSSCLQTERLIIIAHKGKGLSLLIKHNNLISACGSFHASDRRQ